MNETKLEDKRYEIFDDETGKVLQRLQSKESLAAAHAAGVYFPPGHSVYFELEFEN